MTSPQSPAATVLARALLPQRTPVRGVPLKDRALVAVLLLVQTGLAIGMPSSDGRTPDPLGWTLLTAMALALLFRRRAPWLVTVAVIAMDGPYHALDNAHTAAVPAGLIALFSLAVAGPPLRTYCTLGCVVGTMGTVMFSISSAHEVAEMLRGSGWLVVVVLTGEALRIHRNYVAAIVERAERAERTREQEGARRVAEERLRIARDLHDLLAHSITLIGVQTSVAAHVLVADPERLDRDAVAKSLDGIADTCRDARAELRTTLEVLRASDQGGEQGTGGGPLPGLSGVPDLARAARGAGARVELTVRLGAGAAGPPGSRTATSAPAPEAALDTGPDTGPDAVPDAASGPEPPPVVGAAIYRIVQEALTNAVRHAGPTVGVQVTVGRTADGDVRLTVLDDGDQHGTPALPAARPGEPQRPGAQDALPRPAADAADAAEVPGTAPGFGIVGMRERARSVGGTLDARPRTDAPGFSVTAVLPLTGAHGAHGAPGPHGADPRVTAPAAGPGRTEDTPTKGSP